jgi:hypothetical protein
MVRMTNHFLVKADYRSTENYETNPRPELGRMTLSFLARDGPLLSPFQKYETNPRPPLEDTNDPGLPFQMPAPGAFYR